MNKSHWPDANWHVSNRLIHSLIITVACTRRCQPFIPMRGLRHCIYAGIKNNFRHVCECVTFLPQNVFPTTFDLFFFVCLFVTMGKPRPRPKLNSRPRSKHPVKPKTRKQSQNKKKTALMIAKPLIHKRGRGEVKDKAMQRANARRIREGREPWPHF